MCVFCISAGILWSLQSASIHPRTSFSNVGICTLQKVPFLGRRLAAFIRGVAGGIRGRVRRAAAATRTSPPAARSRRKHAGSARSAVIAGSIGTGSRNARSAMRRSRGRAIRMRFEFLTAARSVLSSEYSAWMPYFEPSVGKGTAAEAKGRSIAAAKHRPLALDGHPAGRISGRISRSLTRSS